MKQLSHENSSARLTFRLWCSTDYPCVCSNGCLHCRKPRNTNVRRSEWILNSIEGSTSRGFTFGILKLDNYVVLENVDLFNTRNGVHSYSFQGALKPLVVSGRGLVNCLLLPVISGKLSTARGEISHTFVLLLS